MARGRKALSGDVLATDEALRRARAGVAFRTAYREVAAELVRGDTMPAVENDALLKARSSTGAMGNLALGELRGRARDAVRWNAKERSRFDAAMNRLARARRR